MMEMNPRIYNRICNDKLTLLSERIDFLEEIKTMLKLPQYVGMSRERCIELHKKDYIRELVKMMDGDPDEPSNGVITLIKYKYEDAEGDIEGRLKKLKREYDDIAVNGISKEYYKEAADLYVDMDLGDDYE